jgi:uncharacterized membrane protein YdbT with pleckstrin-like domain
MSYLTKNLLNGEVIIHQARITKYKYVPCINTAVVGSLFFVYKNYIPNSRIPDFDFAMMCIGGVLIWVGAFVAMHVFVQILSTEILATNKRLILKKGLIRRNIKEYPLMKIERVNIKQGITERIFDIGSISIEGTGGGVILIEDIGAPMQLYKNIMQAIENRAP